MKKDHPSRGRRRTGGPVVGQTGARFGGTAGRRCRAADEPPAEDGATETYPEQASYPERIHDERGDQAAVGQVGARFPPILRRERHQEEEQGAEQPAIPPPGIAPPGSEWAPPELVAPEWAQASPAASISSLPRPVEEADWDTSKWDTSREDGPHEDHSPHEDHGLVRPYFWTGGRTRPRVHLAVEALVSATGQETDPVTRPEHRAILGLCATPRSVAELAALLKVPLGVARVLLGDLAAAGSVVVHRTAGSADAAPDVALMQRVLAGLRRL